DNHCKGWVDTDLDGVDDEFIEHLGFMVVEVEKKGGTFPAGNIIIKWKDSENGNTIATGNEIHDLVEGTYCVEASIENSDFCKTTRCFDIFDTSPTFLYWTSDCTLPYRCGHTFDNDYYVEGKTDIFFPNGNCEGRKRCIETEDPLPGIIVATEGQVIDPSNDPTDCRGLELQCHVGSETYNVPIPDDLQSVQIGWGIVEVDWDDDHINEWEVMENYCYYAEACFPLEGDLANPVSFIHWGYEPHLPVFTEQGWGSDGKCYEFYYCTWDAYHAEQPSQQQELLYTYCAKKNLDLPIGISSINYENHLINYLGTNSIPNNLYSVSQFDSSLEPIWEQSLSGAGNIWGTDIANLYDGSVLSVGYFTQDIRTADHWLYASEGAEDILLVKHDVQGNREWLKTIGGIGADKCHSIAVDGMEGMWLTGSFTDEMDIENIRLTGTGQDTYFAKYNGLGYLLWAKALEGTGSNTGLAIETDNEHNAYLLGSFQDDIQFGSKTSENNDDYSDMFLAKYDKDGNFIWRKHARSIATHFEKADMAVDNEGNILVYGAFRNGFSFTPYSEDAIYTRSFKEDLFLVKYNSKGDLLWTRQLGNTEDAMHLGGIETDRYGNILVNGGFEGRATFEGVSLTADGESSIFVAQYSSDGQLDWVKKEGGANKDAATCIAVNPVHGNTYYAGFHYGKAQIEGEEFTSGENVHNGFIVELGGRSERNKNEETIEVVETVPESAMLVEKIYPNPFNREIQIDIQSPRKEKITFDVYNMMGEKTLSEKHPLTEGKNTISLTLKEKIPNGVYLLKIVDGK
ncbi:MAG: T9SS type A sorting domain-containing protein, partial [Chitinophagales bacterium]